MIMVYGICKELFKLFSDILKYRKREASAK